MMVEAILSIQAGDNPRMLREKLETFLPPERRAAAVAQLRKPEDAPAEDKEAAAA
jgi:chemotaxis protein MotA